MSYLLETIEKFFRSISLTDIIGILLIFSVLWMAKVIVKRENENLFKATITLMFFFAIFLYLSQNESNKFTISDLKNTFFPEKTIDIKYRISKGVFNQREYIRYIFLRPYPPLTLKMDKTGSYFHIKNPESVNRVLRFLALPEVKEGVPELSSITGSIYNVSHYRWDKYPRGTLILEKTLCRSEDAITVNHCILQITIQPNY